jgi:hypothetical protein
MLIDALKSENVVLLFTTIGTKSSAFSGIQIISCKAGLIFYASNRFWAGVFLPIKDV